MSDNTNVMSMIERELTNLDLKSSSSKLTLDDVRQLELLVKLKLLIAGESTENFSISNSELSTTSSKDLINKLKIIKKT